MHVVRVRIRNFRDIATGDAHLSGHTVFVGDNNAGKSTLLEAIDLVLGPERLNRRPVIDEHDVYAGTYVDPTKQEIVPIRVEVIMAGLSEEQQCHFRDHVELLQGIIAPDFFCATSDKSASGQPRRDRILPYINSDLCRT